MQGSIAVVAFLCLVCSLVDGQSTLTCSSFDFASLRKTCCKSKFPVYVNDTLMKLCNPKKNAALISWTTDYKLNKLQVKSMGNVIDLTNKNVKTLACTVGPFMNCLFRNAGLLKPDGFVDDEIAAKFVNTTTPNGEWKEIASDTAEMGVPYSMWMPSLLRTGVKCPSGPKKTDPLVNVTLGVIFLQQMFLMTMFEQCPTLDEGAGCMKTYEKHYDCVGSLWENLNIGEERVKLNWAKKRAAMKQNTTFYGTLRQLKRLRLGL